MMTIDALRSPTKAAVATRATKTTSSRESIALDLIARPTLVHHPHRLFASRRVTYQRRPSISSLPRSCYALHPSSSSSSSALLRSRADFRGFRRFVPLFRVTKSRRSFAARRRATRTCRIARSRVDELTKLRRSSRCRNTAISLR